MFFLLFFALSFLFFFFPLVSENEENIYFTAETNDFDQRTEAEHLFAGQNTQQH